LLATWQYYLVGWIILRDRLVFLLISKLRAMDHHFLEVYIYLVTIF